MRLTLAALTVFAALLPAAPAHADPLICVVTGAVHVGDITYDPPDPCLL